MREILHSLNILNLASTWNQGVSHKDRESMRERESINSLFLSSPLLSSLPPSVAIVGLNGVGKSTLLNLLLGKLEPVCS